MRIRSRRSCGVSCGTIYEPTATPFRDDERYQAWLLGDAAGRSIIGCADCDATGQWDDGPCDGCHGWGFVAAQYDDDGRLWPLAGLPRESPPGR
jgi:hypothetical protein